MTRKRLFVAALALQLAVLSWVAIPRLVVLHTGRTALLKTVPVDPRDPFRGDYVVLNYEVSTVPASAGVHAGDTVFVVLQERDGYASATRYTKARPDDGSLYLEGRVEERWGSFRAHFGIEAFFVPEGRGRALERQRGHDVRVRVSSRGFAVIDALVRRPGAPVDEDRGPRVAPAAVLPDHIDTNHPRIRLTDGTERQYVPIGSYYGERSMLFAVLQRGQPDTTIGGSQIQSFFTADPKDVRLLMHLRPVAARPGWKLTSARLLVAVPRDRTLEVRTMRRGFGVSSQSYSLQALAPTWNCARYPDERWAAPGVLGSSDCEEKPRARLLGDDALQGIDITTSAQGLAGAPTGLLLTWADDPTRVQLRAPNSYYDVLGHAALELTFAPVP